MTINQQHRFFFLIDKLNYDKKELIQAAEEKYNKKFMEISAPEMNMLINVLEKEYNQTQQAPIKEPSETFPNFFRRWENGEMIWSRGNYGKNVMQWTGKIDINDFMICDFDYVKTVTGDIYLVQWSWDDCAWVGYKENSEFPDERVFLASFTKLTIVGNVYEGVKE